MKNSVTLSVFLKHVRGIPVLVENCIRLLRVLFMLGIKRDCSNVPDTADTDTITWFSLYDITLQVSPLLGN